MVFFALAARAADNSFSLARESDASALVQAALDAEVAGDSAQRAELLKDAVAADPDFAPARWHSGQVKFDGQWRETDDVQNLVANHPRWVGYRELRDSLGVAFEDHLQLAEYCRENNLSNEGRYHWANVLLAEPANKAARQYLGLEEYRGGLFTRPQVAYFKNAEKDAETNLKKHQPVLTRLCRDATLADPARRAAALAEIGALTDSSAIGALEQVAEKACAKAPKYADTLHLAVVAALANMPDYEATLRLLNHAVYADSGEVSDAAARALAPRDQTDYVPLLMAALRAPIEVDFDVLTTPDGSVRVAEKLYRAGATAQATHLRKTDMLTEGAFGRDANAISPAEVLAGNLDRAANQLAETQARVESANAQAAAHNERIVAVLRAATGTDLSDDAETWWKHWEAENELQSIAEENTVSTVEETSFVYFYPQAPIRYPSSEPRGNLSRRPEPRENVRLRPEQLRESASNAFALRRERIRQRALGGSCFVPGTLVWTQAGPVAIELVDVGDLVLAQNPHTGELDYRPVLAVTIGKPVTVHELRLREETIGTTRGHRFWLPGRGWEMAKHLGPAARLLALGGSVEVESVGDGPTLSCHNLVVDEFHTYFVGQSRVLVHDITCPQAERATIPGSRTMRAWNPAAPVQTVAIGQ